MSAYEHEHGHDHDHDHHQEHAPGPVRDDRLHDDRAQDGGPGAARLFEAAATGRADVVGASGLGALQRAVGNGAVGAMVQRSRSAAPEAAEEGARSPVHDVLASGGGQPLDTATRGDMEARMGADFSDVRIHTDAAADASAKGIGAHAYTVGNNVVFQREAYDPASPQGRTTLAHELTHVIQQRSGPVEGTEAPGGIRVSDPSDRFEREAVANAERVLAEPSAPAPAPAPVAAPASSATAAPAVQRAATEDEDEQPADVQGSFVQRAAEAGAEEEEEAPSA
ncbi:eCIS core domain-containing protein [Streptomyces hydrogenans]|uniref:eCIS core domain-containing protein n=1 Tax=Streptomyces hydrogenans TaxID=1873719 RepID=UPI0035E09495